MAEHVGFLCTTRKGCAGLNYKQKEQMKKSIIAYALGLIVGAIIGYKVAKETEE